MEPLTIESKLEFKDYFGLYYPVLFKNLFVRALLFSMPFVAVVLSFMDSWGVGISYAMAIVLVIFYFILHNYKSAKRKFNLFMKGEKRIAYIFTPSGICKEVISVDTTCPWEEIAEVEETKNVLLFNLTKKSMIIMPKRDFSTGQWEQLKVLLNSVPGLIIKLK